MKTKKQLIVYLLSFALLFSMLPVTTVSAAKKISLSSKKITITTGKSKTLKVKNTKKKVKWKILSGKKYISLKVKNKTAVTIKAKKKGTAKVQASVGKTKLTCKVTVKNAASGNTSKSDTTNTPKAPATSTVPTKTPATTPTSKPTDTPAGSHEEDVKVLTAIIKEQRGHLAMVSEDLNSDQYTWENGRLTGIHWAKCEVGGDLDVSGLYALVSLDCGSVFLNSLNVSKNVNLETLNCSWAQLSSLDVSHNANLKTLNCSNTYLSSLDVSKNVNLETLNCSNTHLSSLDVRKNVNLKTLWCYWNQLNSLDLTNNIALTELYCDNNVNVIGYDGPRGSGNG